MKLPPASAPRADHATTLLRSRIIEGSIAPGALLAESVVARELGVNRVPVTAPGETKSANEPEVSRRFRRTSQHE
ncbi:MAG: hypothetical protein B9S33_01535 [Pedosphaera sp. Tous-C6FEB]|nr:MAG: hypothetical protein B9S33_01535 [Pedosphaera sp. Tous-C6FEB]